VTDRERALQALKDLTPAIAVTRIWGRMEGATPEQVQEGNAWAVDLEDIVDVVLRAIGRE
jgi:hypothetical protein